LGDQIIQSAEEAQAASERGRRGDSASSSPKRASGRQAQLGVAEELELEPGLEPERGQWYVVDGVFVRLSSGLSSNLLWPDQREPGHLMEPVRVPVVGVLLPLEEEEEPIRERNCHQDHADS